MWVHADDQSGAVLKAAHEEGDIVQEALGLFPGMAWILSTIVVEEVGDEGQYYRIRFSNARKYTP